MYMDDETKDYGRTVEYQHLMLWPGRERNVHCHTVKLEPDWTVSVPM